jgi:hypothetical protein
MCAIRSCVVRSNIALELSKCRHDVPKQASLTRAHIEIQIEEYQRNIVVAKQLEESG